MKVFLLVSRETTCLISMFELANCPPGEVQLGVLWVFVLLGWFFFFFSFLFFFFFFIDIVYAKFHALVNMYLRTDFFS